MRNISLLLALFAGVAAMADTLSITKVRHSGSYEVKAPVVFDSINNAQIKYSAEKVIDTPVRNTLPTGRYNSDLTKASFAKGTLNVVGFNINASAYIKDFAINVSGTKKYKTFADGKEYSGTTALTPGCHSIDIRFIADSAHLAICIPNSKVSEMEGSKRLFTMAENLGTRVITSNSLSPSGKWAIISYSWYDTTNKRHSKTLLHNISSGTQREIQGGATWMPQSDRYYVQESTDGKNVVKSVDPQTGQSRILSNDMPSTYFALSPTEEFAIVMMEEKSPEKEKGVYEIIHPDDRQPGWRSRYSLARYDFSSGVVQPLTYTYRRVSVDDISPDGRHLLFSMANDSIQGRPTGRASYYIMNLSTLETKEIVDNEGFTARAIFAGGTEKVVFSASTEAFGGIGKRLPEGRIPNAFDYHLYVMDTTTGTVTPVTADDKTSIEDMAYSAADGGVYYLAQNADSVSLFRLDMKTYASSYIPQPLEVLSGLSVASQGGNIMVSGSSACVPYQTYNISQPVGKRKIQKILDPNKEMYDSIMLGEAKPWRFHTSRGYDVTGFYFLPPNFNTGEKYPVIVHYYGGCSPTSRRFGGGSHYPAHYWNAMGYIVLMVNPSGASGFGQEWASRHVNTMGEGPAQDIIDATRQFAKDIPQADSTKIGCVSASYGGFMTQYMLTKDNPFACGISHAGISDHSSYWGEGFWGYSYSEVCAADSYPWTRKDLFVDRSPLFNADKITKPLLLTHGTADTNVPPGESIQMYTALKLLGTPTGLILVEGENHHIMDPEKRITWINSMVAWFDRWLKGDATWWDAIYKPKKL